MSICVTGHRPIKLYGYDMRDRRWFDLRQTLKEILRVNNCDEAKAERQIV